MCASAMLRALVRRSHYILPLADSTAIGLGDSDYYDELARPLDARQIVPMLRQPELSEEARAVYRAWYENSNRIRF